MKKIFYIFLVALIFSNFSATLNCKCFTKKCHEESKISKNLDCCKTNSCQNCQQKIAYYKIEEMFTQSETEIFFSSVVSYKSIYSKIQTPPPKIV